MKTDLPLSHQRQSHTLTGKEYIELLKIELVNPDQSLTILRYTSGPSLQFQGFTWNYFPYNLAGVAVDESGEHSRPKLSFPNPESQFSALIKAGVFDMARVVRYRVHPDDLQTGLADTSEWHISRAFSANSAMVVFELRRHSDTPHFTLPARKFLPPEFPGVVL
ncbi:hypothetical protein PU634_10285 [Oceanimonas pelagia]|uniref:Uncharacterized protein n=1 Tax=Oceanimonas pelagia TaxID=3028314 RepID=A0AA50Q944_9GAMM|nr:hypothetical protein [Oceanimonas pelagia]WMC09503.1 hypothetical protein PU634_10285 [Oceanimonas pelagia]